MLAILVPFADVQDLLGLTEMTRGKDNKALIAANIMYIVSQYPRFLKAHWRLLVSYKLRECVSENALWSVAVHLCVRLLCCAECCVLNAFARVRCVLALSATVVGRDRVLLPVKPLAIQLHTADFLIPALRVCQVTVVRKLFEFMKEKHQGVQDMACETFLKIADKCRRKFVYPQERDPAPFIHDILTNLPNTISDLEPHQGW